MARQSYWDFAEFFTGREVAALFFGLDPIKDDLTGTAPFLSRMRDSYQRTLLAHQMSKWLNDSEFTGIPFVTVGTEGEPFEDTNLHSLRMGAFYAEVANPRGDSRIKEGLFEIAEDRFNRWLDDDLSNGFDHQLFEPFEIDRWLKAMGFTSVYRFIGKSEDLEDRDLQISRIQHRVAARRDLLSPVIELAQSQCQDGLDASEVWTRLRALAINRHGPLIGVDDTGIQFVDANDRFKTLSLRALRMRLRRVTLRHG